MKNPTILLVGGGSGGHITPLLAVADELRLKYPDSRIIFVTERGGKFTNIIYKHDKNAEVKQIWAGKLRRYHGVSVWKQVLDINTIALNLRDIVLLAIGSVESAYLILTKRPNVIFVKGGFVSLPVGTVATILRKPYITHDSDTLPSLTNKMIGRGAKLNLMALTTHSKNYDPKKIRKVGVPIDSSFRPADQQTIALIKKKLGVKQDSTVLLVVGGSIGADRLNKAVYEASLELLAKNPSLYIIHQIGSGQDNGSAQHERLRTVSFIDNMSEYGAISDIVISIAGATAISEFATLQKPLILVPNPHLTSGHQLENADLLAKANACIVIDESPDLAVDIIAQTQGLLDNTSLRKDLSGKIKQFSSDKSAREIANILGGFIK